MARLRALLPHRRLEVRYLQALLQTCSKTPALLAGSKEAAYSDLLLIEAFSPLTLRPDRDDGLAGANLPSAVDADALELKAIFTGSKRGPGRSSRERSPRYAYWSLWALAQVPPLAVAWEQCGAMQTNAGIVGNVYIGMHCHALQDNETMMTMQVVAKQCPQYGTTIVGTPTRGARIAIHCKTTKQRAPG